MIRFKRNDKIIIIAAVVVLAVAAVGVAMYQSPPPPDTSNTTPGGGNNDYTVEWDITSDTPQIFSEFAGKKAPYENTIKISKGNLHSIDFNMSWVDDHTTLLGRRGLDTMILTITAPGGEPQEFENKSAKMTKEGTIQYTLKIGNMPSSEPITAPNIQSAEEQLAQSPYYNDQWVNEELKIQVSCKIGESIFRPLMRLLDKGNDFDLKITFSYWKGNIRPPASEENKQTNSDSSSDDGFSETDYQPPYLYMLLNTGCGRYI